VYKRPAGGTTRTEIKEKTGRGKSERKNGIKRKQVVECEHRKRRLRLPLHTTA